ncbi:MAG: membrane integrity-associated transporter subunit PqiC [Methylococcaceae bacterium]|nr:membrane integrity-associated transporter subunit PqiC [Methylococcaceae bacterium]
MTPRLALFGLTLVLAGCSSAPDRFYTLMPDSRAGPRPVATTKVERVVVVGPVTVPAMVNQAQLVITQGGQQMDVREAERWAAPLKEEFTAALAARLEALLPQMAVAVHHQSAGIDAELRIQVDVSRFELGPGRQTALDALWVVKSDDPTSERRGRTRLAVVAAGDGYQQLAQAQGRALDQLAEALAEAVKAPEHALHGSPAP